MSDRLLARCTWASALRIEPEAVAERGRVKGARVKSGITLQCYSLTKLSKNLRGTYFLSCAQNRPSRCDHVVPQETGMHRCQLHHANCDIHAMDSTKRENIVSNAIQSGPHLHYSARSSSNALASWRSAVSEPAVNQP